jgi:aspartate/glutamate racemase
MKTIGLLGGMSWESTVTYYRLINEGVNRCNIREDGAKLERSWLKLLSGSSL